MLLRGAGNMEGYHNNPDATAETIDAEGWLHTGDIGELDDRGFLRITDRKKDMFKTSGGKYVAPSNIEATFKGLCPYASQLVVYGADRNFVSALVTLDPEAIAGWARPATAWRARPTPRSSAPTRAARWCRATSTSSTRA